MGVATKAMIITSFHTPIKIEHGQLDSLVTMKHVIGIASGGRWSHGEDEKQVYE